jgi:hypothetical protein
MKGMQSYEMDREQIAQKAAYGCSKDAECYVVYTNNQCESGCRAAAVFYGVEDYFTSSLEFSAEQYCQACMPGPVPPCVAPPGAVCDNGQCALRK